MNFKGQFSLDLIIAVVVFIVFANTIIIVVQNFENSQASISIQNQERQIAELVAAKLSQIPILDKSNSADLNFEIPYLLVVGKPSQECSILIIGENIKVSYGNPAIETLVPFKTSTLLNFGTKKCGSFVNCKKNQIWSCS